MEYTTQKALIESSWNGKSVFFKMCKVHLWNLPATRENANPVTNGWLQLLETPATILRLFPILLISDNHTAWLKWTYLKVLVLEIPQLCIPHCSFWPRDKSSLLKPLFCEVTVSSGLVNVVNVGKCSFLPSQVAVKGSSEPHGRKCYLKISESSSLPFSIPDYPLEFPILLTFHT